MPKITITMDVNEKKAFDILADALEVTIDEEVEKNAFVVEDGEIVVKDYDDRGELYLALYHLATKIFPNMECRNLFSNPNSLMARLYLEKDEMTNGEVMKLLFPKVPVKIFKSTNTVTFGSTQFDLNWWKASYEG